MRVLHFLVVSLVLAEGEGGRVSCSCVCVEERCMEEGVTAKPHP
jgi:hypothetical protein